MTPEQEKKLRELSLDDMSKYTIKKMLASSQLHNINNDVRHKEWSSKGGKISGGSKEGREWMREVQKMSIGVPKTFSEEVRKKFSETGKATMSGEHAKRIKTMGGSVAGKISQQIERTCPHCNQTITGPLFFRWHGDKCKMKNNNL